MKLLTILLLFPLLMQGQIRIPVRSTTGPSIGGGVSSFNSRTGAILPQETDYNSFFPSLSGSYNNPSWITGLEWSKITGVPSFLTTESDPTVSSDIKAITATNISNWNSAFSWGNHASVGYLTTTSGDARYPQLSGSYSNPSWITSIAWSKITGAPSFLTTESDPTVGSHIKAITTTNINNWNSSLIVSGVPSNGQIIKRIGSLNQWVNPDTPTIALGWTTGIRTLFVTSDSLTNKGLVASATITPVNNSDSTIGFNVNNNSITDDMINAVSWSKVSGKPTTLSGYGITDATSTARGAISLTTTGSSGAATYNSTTGVLNIPQYSGGSGLPSFAGANRILHTNSTNDAAEWRDVIAATFVKRDSAFLNFPSIDANSFKTLTFTSTGATTDDYPILRVGGNVDGIIFRARVLSANTIQVIAENVTAAAIDPLSIEFSTLILRFW